MTSTERGLKQKRSAKIESGRSPAKTLSHLKNTGKASDEEKEKSGYMKLLFAKKEHEDKRKKRGIGKVVKDILLGD